jgi:hypothetical protein
MTESNHAPEGGALNALLIFCFPEFGTAGTPDDWESASFLGDLEIAVSRSAQERGFLKRLAGKWRVHCESEAEALFLRIGGFDFVVVSPLSLNTLAKFALGIRDSFPTRILGIAADKGIPILLDSSAVPPGDSIMNPHLAKVYRRHWENIRGGTVSEFKADTFAETVNAIRRSRGALDHELFSSRRPVVTRDDVILAAQAMKPISVPRGAIVTALAEEEARSRGIPIQFT